MSEETMVSLMAAMLFTKASEGVDYPDKPWTDDSRLSSDTRAARIAVHRARLIRRAVFEAGRGHLPERVVP